MINIEIDRQEARQEKNPIQVGMSTKIQARPNGTKF